MWDREEVSWSRAVFSALAATHGPFAVMAAYAVVAIPCQHCKKAACYMFPMGPGLVSGVTFQGIFGSTSRFLALATPIFFTLLVVAATVRLARRGVWWALPLVFAVSCALAVVTLGFIRA